MRRVRKIRTARMRRKQKSGARIMLPSGFTDRVGSAGIDTLSATNLQVVFGLAGADALSHGGGTTWLVGGNGNDSYRIQASGTVVVYDSGNTSNDHFYDSAYFVGQSFAAEIDSRHLMLFDNAGNRIFFFDWLALANRIEHFHVATFDFSPEQYLAYLKSKPFYQGNLSIDDVFPGEGALLNATLTDVTARSAAYDAAVAGIVTTTPGVVVGTAASDSPTGTSANDTIFGLAGNDTVLAADGNDVVYGNLDVDSLMGGDGNDTIYGGQNAGPAGADGVQRQGIDSIDGGAGDDVIYGNHGGDLLSGGAGHDTIYGGQDNDSMFGGSGNDLLVGGLGADTLTGNSGADRFVFTAASQSASLSTADTIAEFTLSDQDRIDLSAIDANDSVSGDQAFTFLGSSTTGGANAVWYTVSGGNTFVFASTNGDAVAELTIRLNGLATLTGAEFSL